MADYVLQLKNINKYFGKSHVIKNVNLSFERGHFITFLGPSGCGKTTLLRMIAGIYEPDEGEILLNGKNVERIPPYGRNTSMVFQEYALFPHMNVFDNVSYGLKVKKVPKDEMIKRVEDALELMQLKGMEKRFPNQMSGGQQQRVAVARALVMKPDVLLLDEPLSNLDAKLRESVRVELRTIQQKMGLSVIYVTHDQSEALSMSDAVVVLKDGEVHQVGTPQEIYFEPKTQFVADFIGESNILNGTMIKDRQVSFAGHEFECVDEGFGEQMPVDVVLRPEDIYIFEPSEAAMLTGTVTSSIFKGVHYEMMVQTPNGYEFMVQDYHCFEAGSEVGLLIKPFDIHVMKKERICNTFEGKLIDATHVEFLGCTFECKEVTDIEPNTPVKVEIDFKDVILEDNEEDGRLTGEVKFILYKGNHYHLTVFTDWDEDIFVDTNDVWDDGDHVGITIAPDKIRIIHA